MPFFYKHFRVLKSFIRAKGPETTKSEKFYYERCLCQLSRPSDAAALSSNELNLSKHWCLSGCYYQSYFSFIIFIFTLCKQRLLKCFVQAQSWPSLCACNHLKYSLHVENRELKGQRLSFGHASFILIHTTPQLLLCGCTARDGTCQSYLLKSRYPVKMTCMPKSVRSTMGFKGWQECEPAQNIYVWYLLLW